MYITKDKKSKIKRKPCNKINCDWHTIYLYSLKENEANAGKAKHTPVDAITPPEPCRQRQMFPAMGEKKKTKGVATMTRILSTSDSY